MQLLIILLNVVQLFILKLQFIFQSLILGLDIPLDLIDILLSITLRSPFHVFQVLRILIFDPLLNLNLLQPSLLFHILQFPLQSVAPPHLLLQLFLSFILSIVEVVQHFNTLLKLMHFLLFLFDVGVLPNSYVL